jgi:hypothetical protein
MAWYPGATRMELQPESDGQAAIRPTQVILHSLAAPWTARRTYEFWRDSSSLESHFGLGFEGDLAQYIGTETRADANAAANRRPDGTGAVSIETASNLHHGVWLHQHHGIPLRICRTHDDPGFGYHRLHSQWAASGTACPGDARVKQFREVVFPGIVRAAGQSTPIEEDDMTPEQAKQLAELHRDRRVAPWQYNGQLEDGDAWQLLRNTAAGAAATVAGVQELKARVTEAGAPQLTDAHVAAIADKVANSPALANRIADLVAEKLAARLAE